MTTSLLEGDGVAKSGRIWRVAKIILLILAGLVAVFFLVVVPWFFTHLLTTNRFHFHDPNDGQTPQTYGMAFSPVEFQSSDGITLRGWYVPASGAAKGTIVYCHGQNRTRIEMLPMAAFAHGLGYDGLLFDFRHQGASGGKISTIGYQERLDAEAAVRYALGQEHTPQPVVLWGVSMGAAAALMAAAETPDVAAVISDSTFLSYRDVIIHHWKLFLHLPSFPIADEIIYASAWKGGFWPSDFDLRKAVERIDPRPVLFIAVEDDRRMPPSIARTLDRLATSPEKALVVLPGSRHGEGFKSGHEAYEQAVTRFLAELASSPSGR